MRGCTQRPARGVARGYRRGGRATFCSRGFGSVSMDELAEAAGVARRTLYNQCFGW